MSKLKKICVIIIVICTILIVAVLSMSNDSSKKTYTITGETLGEYGKRITLNKNTDMPTDKYLYKIPAGTYTATTNNDSKTSFFIVKDEIHKTDDEKYPEKLNYVEEASYLLTKGQTVEFTIKEDESIQLVGTDNLNITEK